jgi:hypothetical protein
MTHIAIIANKFLNEVIVSSYIDQIEEAEIDNNLINIAYIFKWVMIDHELSSNVNDFCVESYEDYLNDNNENMIYTADEIYNYLEINKFFNKQIIISIYQHFHP